MPPAPSASRTSTTIPTAASRTTTAAVAASRKTTSSPAKNSSLDHFGARHYASTMGRFMTPDWSEEPDPVPHANIQNPQTLNLYGYVQNNPLSRRDADGNVTCD